MTRRRYHVLGAQHVQPCHATSMAIFFNAIGDLMYLTLSVPVCAGGPAGGAVLLPLRLERGVPPHGSAAAPHHRRPLRHHDRGWLLRGGRRSSHGKLPRALRLPPPAGIPVGSSKRAPLGSCPCSWHACEAALQQNRGALGSWQQGLDQATPARKVLLIPNACTITCQCFAVMQLSIDIIRFWLICSRAGVLVVPTQ